MKSIVLSFLLALLLSSCNSNQKNITAKESVPQNYMENNLSGNIIADTITYDVIIKNPDPNDYWTAQFLKNLKKDEFIDQLFENIYQEKIQVYDHLTLEPLSIEDVENLEQKKDFTRDKIGKIQFTESWLFDTAQMTMRKKVISLTLGYEYPINSEDSIAYKAAFKVFLN